MESWCLPFMTNNIEKWARERERERKRDCAGKGNGIALADTAGDHQ